MEETALQTQWGTLIALYLFLGGLAAGTLCVSALIKLRTKDRLVKTVRFGSWAGTILLVVGILCLLAETSMPTRAILLWRAFVNPTSWMTIGAWLLVLAVIVAGLFALSSTEALTGKLTFLKRIQSGLAVLTIPLSLGVALYTGILLGVLVSHPLWNTWLLPALFTVSALDTGVALILGFMILRERKAKPAGEVVTETTVEPVSEAATEAAVEPASEVVVKATTEVATEPATKPVGKVTIETTAKPVVEPAIGSKGKDTLDEVKTLLEKATIGLVLLELIVLAIYLFSVSTAGGVASASVQLLTSGILSPYFWLLLVICGLAVPLAISLILVLRRGLPEKARSAVPLLGALLCLMGGCTLRFLILLAGLPVHFQG